MLIVYCLNFCLFFPAVITLVFAMKDLDAAVNDYTLYPPIYVIRQSMSVAWETAVIVMIIALLMWANVTYMTAVSRDLWAFARDGGLPCSNWIAKVSYICLSVGMFVVDGVLIDAQVDPKRHVPTNAILVTSGVAVVLSLIYIGSPVAFYAITSLLTVSLLQCYMFSIGSILWRRISCPETLPPTQFSLGRFGVPINVAGFAFCAWAFVSSHSILYVLISCVTDGWNCSSGPSGQCLHRQMQHLSTGRVCYSWQQSFSPWLGILSKRERRMPDR